MESKSDSLIAYNVLKKKIIDSGFCTACGACEVACPVGALQIEDDKVKRIHNCADDLDLCPICYAVCPHSEALLLRSLRAVSDAPIKNEAIGYYRKMLLAQAADPKLREQCRGAGVVTALLTYGVENKIFDSAIVSQAELGDPTKTKPMVAVVPDDILSAVGTKFFPSAVAKAYGTAVMEYGKTKIAFVGVPCHVLALRKLGAWQHKISGNLKIIIGLFCFGTFSLKPLMEYITKTYNIKPSDIKQMRLSKNLVIQTEKESINIPFEELQSKILPSCRTCVDFTSEFADISVGRAFPLTDWSVVIIRTKTGEDFFFDAAEKGVINLRAIEEEPKVFERVIGPAIKKRTEALRAAGKLEETQGFIPARLLRETDLLAHVKVEEIMTRKVRSVPSNMTVSELLELMAAEQHGGYPVTNEKNELVGIVTIEEVSFVDKKKRGQTSVGAIARPNLDVVYPGETALDAYKKMSKQETGRVLVLDPENPQRVIGIVTKADLLHALVNQA
ncbi:MAG: Coenzyme F420 hydrogenase/dehydrogenase, beta subunit C-terminal domain [Candidatus Bathyarchaeia archaeon]